MQEKSTNQMAGEDSKRDGATAGETAHASPAKGPRLGEHAQRMLGYGTNTLLALPPDALCEVVVFAAMDGQTFAAVAVSSRQLNAACGLAAQRVWKALALQRFAVVAVQVAVMPPEAVDYCVLYQQHCKLLHPPPRAPREPTVTFSDFWFVVEVWKEVKEKGKKGKKGNAVPVHVGSVPLHAWTNGRPRCGNDYCRWDTDTTPALASEPVPAALAAAWGVEGYVFRVLCIKCSTGACAVLCKGCEVDEGSMCYTLPTVGLYCGINYDTAYRYSGYQYEPPRPVHQGDLTFCHECHTLFCTFWEFLYGFTVLTARETLLLLEHHIPFV